MTTRTSALNIELGERACKALLAETLELRKWTVIGRAREAQDRRY